METGDLIVYTSAVTQIAAHEDIIPLEEFIVFGIRREITKDDPYMIGHCTSVCGVNLATSKELQTDMTMR